MVTSVDSPVAAARCPFQKLSAAVEQGQHRLCSCQGWQLLWRVVEDGVCTAVVAAAVAGVEVCACNGDEEEQQPWCDNQGAGGGVGPAGLRDGSSSQACEPTKLVVVLSHSQMHKGVGTEGIGGWVKQLGGGCARWWLCWGKGRQDPELWESEGEKSNLCFCVCSS